MSRSRSTGKEGFEVIEKPPYANEASTIAEAQTFEEAKEFIKEMALSSIEGTAFGVLDKSLKSFSGYGRYGLTGTYVVNSYGEAVKGKWPRTTEFVKYNELSESDINSMEHPIAHLKDFLEDKETVGVNRARRWRAENP